MTNSTASAVASEINRAIVFCNKGRRQEALKIFRQLSFPLPEDLEVKIQFGHLCVSLGDYPNAIVVFKAIALQYPENTTYLTFLGDAYLQNEQFDNAEIYLLKSYKLDAENWKTLASLGAFHLTLGNYHDASKYLNSAIQLKPSHAATHANMAACCLKMGQHQASLVYADKAIKLDPQNLHACNTMGYALSEIGRAEEAEKYFEKAIKINKLFGEAYLNWSRIKKYSKKDLPQIKKIEKYLLEGMHSSQRKYFHFSLGKMHNDCHNWDEAFQHFRQANLLGKSGCRENPLPDNFLKFFKKLFTAKMLALYSGELGSHSETPVFVVGMPRSGTTLIEQIISSHPLAAGASELTKIGEISNAICPLDDLKHYNDRWIKELKPARFEVHIKEYLSVLKNDRANALRIVDKMPDNYLHLGLITLLFPRAKIIHVTRNPLDTCLSCYFQHFTSISWSYDMQWIANRYNQYRKIIEFWKTVIPAENIQSIEYEKLVTSPEKYSRQMIDYIGLEWNATCLDFHKQERAVNTASVWQVRQPIYQSSMRNWQHYLAHVVELASALLPYLDEEDERALKDAGVNLRPKRWWHSIA